jgi:hypothetical protein
LTLSGHAYLVHFKVAPDPRSQFTQADYQRSYDESMRQMARLSQLDTILNNLDDLKKAIDTATDTAKKTNNAALTATLSTGATARQTLFDTLAVHVRGEGTEDETRVHEDLLGAYFQSQALITPAIADFISRIDAEYRAGVDRYNTFVTGQMPALSAALRQAGVKTVPTLTTVRAL